MAQLDHLVVAVTDLDTGRRWWHASTGVEPAVGGSHPGRGTHNALASLGSSYVELIAPDPGQPDPPAGRPFGLDDVVGPGLVTFAVRPDPGATIDDLIAAARAAGHDPGAPVAMSRRRPDGSDLHWRLTLPNDGDRTTPFLIDWGAARMPSESAPGGLSLDEFEATSPDPVALQALVDALGLTMRVSTGRPALRATVGGPGGTLVLESAPRRGDP